MGVMDVTLFKTQLFFQFLSDFFWRCMPSKSSKISREIKSHCKVNAKSRQGIDRFF